MSQLSDLLAQHDATEARLQRDQFIESWPTKEFAEAAVRLYAGVLTDLGLTGDLGLYTALVPSLGWAVYVGSHDTPKTAVARKRRRLFGQLTVIRSENQA